MEGYKLHPDKAELRFYPAWSLTYEVTLRLVTAPLSKLAGCNFGEESKLEIFLFKKKNPSHISVCATSDFPIYLTLFPEQL